MARTALPVTEVPFQGGLNAVPFGAVDQANGMVLDNDGLTILVVKNAAAGPVTVTVKSVADEAGRSGDVVLTVAAGGTGVVGPLRPAWWHQRDGADAGRVQVDFSASANITAAALRLRP